MIGFSNQLAIAGVIRNDAESSSVPVSFLGVAPARLNQAPQNCLQPRGPEQHHYNTTQHNTNIIRRMTKSEEWSTILSENIQTVSINVQSAIQCRTPNPIRFLHKSSFVKLTYDTYHSQHALTFHFNEYPGR